jgi:hypothetical protein
MLPVCAAECYCACVDEPQKRKPLFWPVLFMGAFAVGGILWCVWMWHIVQKTRESRDNGFFVPMSGETAPASSNPAAMPSNAPAAPANSGATNAK